MDLIYNISLLRIIKKLNIILNILILTIVLPKSFGEKKGKLKNYGVLCYNYKHIINKNSSYTPNDVNLGDYIQSLAAWQYLPKNYKPVFIDRDSLKYYNEENVTMIMNGWYFLNENNDYFSDNINPIFVSFHISNTNDINNSTVEYLKKHEPIGCRDKNTRKLLNKYGIRAYFSGCLTTTLDIDYKVDNSEREDNIIFCDYKFGDYGPADEILKSMKNYNFNKTEFTTHSYTLNSSHEQRFELSIKLLKKYAKAKLVITSRIHCALPCLAMGTPVILINKKYDKKRYSGIYKLLNTIGINEKGKFSKNIKFDDNGNVINSNYYLKFSNKLKQRIRDEI